MSCDIGGEKYARQNLCMALTGSIPVTVSLIVNDVSPRREKKFLRFGGFFC